MTFPWTKPENPNGTERTNLNFLRNTYTKYELKYEENNAKQ